MSAVTPFNTTNIGVFQPNQIGGLALWLDAADSSTVVTSGANVTAWNDKSGNSGRNATAFSNPTLSNINGLQAMNMTNGPYFTGAVSITGTTLTCFAVASSSRIPNNGPSDQRIVSLARTGTNDYGDNRDVVALFNSWTADKSDITTYRTFAKKATASISLNTPFIAVSQYDGTSGFLWKDGTAGSLTGTASSGSFAIQSYGIGNQATPSGELWQGTIGEVLVFSSALSTTQRQQVESYLAYKWNLQGSLPTSHPYYNSPYNAIASFTNINQITKFGYSVLPNQIGGLALWLDAADGSTLFQNTAGTTPVTNGSQVQLWKDKSSSANNATNSQTVMTYNGNGLNGLPAISFPGTQTIGFSLSGALLPNGTSNSSYFFVLNMSANSTFKVFFANGGGGLQTRQFYGNVDNTLAIDRAGTPIISDSTNVANSNIIVSSTLTSLAGGVNGWRNGNPFSTTAGTNLWNVGTTDAFLGTNTTGIFQYVGVISEVIVYNSALTTTQRQAVESYLAYKWNLQGSLPVTHPYYNNAFIPNLPRSVPTTIIPYIYSPRSLSGLALWLDAADAATVLRTGANITAWIDKSGNGYTVTGASPSQPTYTSDTISFNGSQFFTTNYTNFPAAESIFIIVNVSLPSGEGTFLQPNQNGGRQFYLEFSKLQTARSSSAVLLDSTMIYNLRTLVESTNSGTSLNHFINGLNVGSNNSVTPYIGTGSTTTIGARSIGDRGITGSIHEVVIFSSVLTTNQRQQIEGYLAWKWGLQASLPANHPNKLYPPG